MITVLINIALAGFLVWLLTFLVPMPEKWKQVIVAIALVFVFLYVLSAFGLYSLPSGLK